MKLRLALAGMVFCAPMASAQVLYGPAAITGGTINGAIITGGSLTGANVTPSGGTQTTLGAALGAISGGGGTPGGSSGQIQYNNAGAFGGVAAPSGVIVGTTDTQTLTNKSIAASEVNSGTLAAARLPLATSSTLGAAQCDGTTIACTSGVISAIGGGGSSTIPVTTVATSGASQSIAFPASGSAAYDITLTANCTITLSGGTAGQYQTITLFLRQDATAGRTPTLPAGVKWPGGVTPTPNTLAGKIDVYTISTPDAGTTKFGSY